MENEFLEQMDELLDLESSIMDKWERIDEIKRDLRITNTFKNLTDFDYFEKLMSKKDLTKKQIKDLYIEYISKYQRFAYDYIVNHKHNTDDETIKLKKIAVKCLIDNPDRLMYLSQFLPEELKKIVYKTHHDYYIDKYKKSFRYTRWFCELFSEYVSQDELRQLILIAVQKKNNSYLGTMQTKFPNMSKDNVDKIMSARVAHKLRGA